MSNGVSVTFNDNSSPGDAWSIEVDPMTGYSCEASLTLQMLYSSDGGKTWSSPIPAGQVWQGGATTDSGNYDGWDTEQYEGQHQYHGYMLRRQYNLHIIYTELSPPNSQQISDQDCFSTATQY